MSGYMLMRGSEDGKPVTFLTAEQLKVLLANPGDYAGIQSFVTPEDVDPDPDYWPKGYGILLRYEIVVPIPARGFRLPDESERAS